MLDILILTLDAPLMSFGAPIVDQLGRVQPFPARSMLTGLLANALGYDHSDADATTRLQARLRYASRADQPGRRLTDFQTVDLGLPHMHGDRAWTTRGAVVPRKGGSGLSTHIRYREFWQDAFHVVALTLLPADHSPNIDELADALRSPARPLFIGRKCCLPSRPLLYGRRQTLTLLDALRREPLFAQASSPRPQDFSASEATTDPMLAVDALNASIEGTSNANESIGVGVWWPSEDAPETPTSRTLKVFDSRDWVNQIHHGERIIFHDHVSLHSSGGHHA